MDKMSKFIIAKEVEDLLADKEIDVILNLTNPTSHYETIKKTLIAGKHSYCEKPLSISFEQGKELEYHIHLDYLKCLIQRQLQCKDQPLL